MKKFVPLWDWISLELIEENSPIVMPESVDRARSGVGRFRVAAIGPDVRGVALGDIIFSQIPISRFEAEGSVYYTVQEKHLMGKFEPLEVL